MFQFFLLKGWSSEKSYLWFSYLSHILIELKPNYTLYSLEIYYPQLILILNNNLSPKQKIKLDKNEISSFQLIFLNEL